MPPSRLFPAWVQMELLGSKYFGSCSSKRPALLLVCLKMCVCNPEATDIYTHTARKLSLCGE
jgi:IS1 family transposase